MLETFAVIWIFQSTLFQLSFGFGFLVLGFAVAQTVMEKSTWALRRAPYFFLAVAVFIVASCASFFEHLATSMTISENLWMYLTATKLGDLSTGFLLGALAHARSRNAHDTGKFAWLAVIPIANIYLHLKPPHKYTPKRGTVHMLANITTVISACLLLFFGLLISNLGSQLSARKTQRILSIPAAQQAYTEAILRTTGLETIIHLFSGKGAPRQIDEITFLDGTVAVGSTLRFEYTIDTQNF